MRQAFLAFIAERPFKTRLTVTLAGHMVTGAIAVDAMRTHLATAVAKETRRTDWEGVGETSGERSGWEKICCQGTDTWNRYTWCVWVLTALAGGSSESRRTLAHALVGWARRSILTVTGQGAVRPPATFSTHAVTVNAWEKHTHADQRFIIIWTFTHSQKHNITFRITGPFT